MRDYWKFPLLPVPKIFCSRLRWSAEVVAGFRGRGAVEEGRFVAVGAGLVAEQVAHLVKVTI
jgi:hypothetical protein